MPLSNLVPGDKFDIVETKLDAAIDKINEIEPGLQGGTTGQILTKSSNTDYDYEWSDDSTDISGKVDISNILTAVASTSGPVAYTTEQTILSLTPSASQSSGGMRFTASGYITNGTGGNVETTLILKNDGVEMWQTKVEPSASGKASFCIQAFDLYVAGKVITLTATSSGASQNISKAIVIAQAFDAE